MNIDFDSTYYAAIPASFEKEKKADWKFEGKYKLYDKIIYLESSELDWKKKNEINFYDPGMIIMKEKHLKMSLKRTNFKPDCDLNIGIEPH